jgi:predicted metal-dependent HD superfamily phosphohydrolase
MSAKAAKEILANFNLTPNTVESTIRLIHATSSHVAQKADLDTNYFLDSDLATLGSPENTYSQYALAIRAEYGWVPESIYRVERRKVLESFITREHIYATKEMSDRFEGQARINILRELSEFLSQS